MDILWIFFVVLYYNPVFSHSDDSPAVVDQAFQGSNGESSNLYSPNFASMPFEPVSYYSTNGGVYTYLLRNTEGGRVGVHFTLWDLNPVSIVKIYDGDSPSGAGSLWYSHSAAPVYTSTANALYIVFKTGKADTANQHIGFHMRYFFSAESSLRPYQNMPSTGYCGSLTTLPTTGSAYMSMKVDDPSALVDCTYGVTTAGAQYFILVLAPSLQWIDDNVVAYNHPGGDAAGSLIYPQSGAQYDSLPPHTAVFISSTAGFYLRIVSANFPEDSSHFTLVYDTTLVEARKALEDATVPATSKCPYKTCPDEKCVAYWEPCQNGDGTCDYRGVEHALGADVPYDNIVTCADSSTCYVTDLDTCDGLRDCTDGEDEDPNIYGCVVEGGFNAAMIAGPVALTALFLFCVFGDKNKRARALAKCRSDRAIVRERCRIKCLSLRACCQSGCRCQKSQGDTAANRNGDNTNRTAISVTSPSAPSATHARRSTRTPVSTIRIPPRGRNTDSSRQPQGTFSPPPSYSQALEAPRNLYETAEQDQQPPPPSYAEAVAAMSGQNHRASRVGPAPPTYTSISDSAV